MSKDVHSSPRRRAGARRTAPTQLPPARPTTWAATRSMAVALALGGTAGAALAENPTEALELPTVSVVGTTPLPGLATPLRDVPANVQMFTGNDVQRQGATNAADFLDENAAPITLNAGQGNPFQPDLNFRGFTASPLLGTPQALSVFQDGVRINEPFGDGVNWDLVPASAISNIQLIPGSFPAFGLNTLGGALAIYTKSGSQNPGGKVEVSGGSFGRKNAQVEYGGKSGKFDYFFTANALNDRGWAQHNPSRLRQAFGKVGWQDERTDIDVSLTLADNKLEGMQTLPMSMWGDIRQPYTWPDTTTNRLGFLNVKASHFLSDNLILGGNAYVRQYRSSNISSNVNEDWNEKDPTSPQGSNDRSNIHQNGYGLGLQLTHLGKLAGRENQFTLGASADFGRSRFTQEAQDANFSASRQAVGTSDFQPTTDAATRNAFYGLFFTNALKLDSRWTLTASGRFNWAPVRIEDRSGTAPELNGSHRFSRFNPGLGVNYTPSDRLTAYASYNEGSRAPTPIELTCADPQAPCKLPNAFLSDPPLKMVVARTVEAGLRGKIDTRTSWSLAAFRTELSDDIQFIAAGGGASNAGYFQNVGKTLRQGIEAGVTHRWTGGLSVQARYAYVDASYRSAFQVHAPANSSADAQGNIAVRSGARMPGIAPHQLKLRVQYDFSERASLGMNLNYSGVIFARGDENNQDARGKIPGFTVVHLDGLYRIGKSAEVFFRVTNLFNRKYATFGTLADNFFTGRGGKFDDNSTPEQFRGPGMPRGIWIGARYRWL